jgi:hypothetical protein
MFVERTMRKKCWAIALLALAMPVSVQAQSEIFGVEAIDAQVDLRTSVVGGETSWVEGGFGKLRYGGDDGDTQPRIKIASADLAWKPRFTWFANGLVSITHQDGQSNDLDLNEAYLKLKSKPGLTQISARGGLFWPPISQEHSGSDWGVTDSITPSAINSWVGEEVKVIGLEAMLKHKFAEHEVSVTGAGFKNNDTSGTLLSYRGWALHDLKATHRGDMRLPPLSASISPYQGSITTPNWELDKKVGYYARIDWKPPAPVSFYAFRYDNRGDRVSSRNFQTAWDTRFWNLGAAAALDDKTVLKTQMMWGVTLVGPDTPWGIPVDVNFASAYLLASREIGNGKFTARADWFQTKDNSFTEFDDNNDENGWAAMLAYKRPIGAHLDALVEVQHVSSDRPTRSLAGLAEQQDQTMVQTSFRFKF